MARSYRRIEQSKQICQDLLTRSPCQDHKRIENSALSRLTPRHSSRSKRIHTQVLNRLLTLYILPLHGNQEGEQETVILPGGGLEGCISDRRLGD